MSDEPSTPSKYNNDVALEDRSADEGRLFSPSAGRNKAIIAQQLSELLPENSRVLEIASGTGEHGAALAEIRADITWQYSDPDPQSRASQSAWATYMAGLPNTGVLKDPLELDMRHEAWAKDIGTYDVIFAANMIHIAPWEAALGLALGAKLCTKLSASILLYGPFLDGEDTALSNLDFDKSLKSRNPEWGVRSIDSVKHIFASQGFNYSSRRDLPKNNLLLGFSR